MHRHSPTDVAFSVYNAADTDDYYTYLPSDESMSDEENSISVASIAAKSHNVVQELTSIFACASSLGPQVLTSIGSLNGNNDETPKKVKSTYKKPTETLDFGVFTLGGHETLQVSSQVLELYHTRKTLLQDALDTIITDHVIGKPLGQLIFHQKDVLKVSTAENVKAKGCFNASPIPMIEKREAHAPEKQNFGRKRAVTMEREEIEDDMLVEQDLLYDEQSDEVDEQWVQTKLRGTYAAKVETDVMLCCPCCFMTVCMACERHVTYSNQYRATAAINCRVKRDEILTYASSQKNCVPTSLPFQKRRNRHADTDHKTNLITPGQQIASLLQADEFYSVTCSDCGTMVGVFGRDQQYHFFNALPSNC